MSKKLTAVVLAAGAGSRFWPITTNKILLPFFGKPLFNFSVLAGLPESVDEVVIVANQKNKEALATIKLPKPSRIIVQDKPMGMADALLSVLENLENSRLLIIIADDVMSSKVLTDAVDMGQKSDAFAVLPGWRANKYFPGGYLKISDNRITGIVEKPNPEAVPSQFVAISGHYFADSEILSAALRGGTGEDVYEQAIHALATTQNILFTPYEGEFSSLKYPWHVLDTLTVLFSTQCMAHRGANVQIKSNVVIEGDVWLGDNVKVFENTKIIGPCYIGDNTIVGNNNIIRESHIGANGVTGFSTDISRSYIGKNCWLHNNYIGDSVLMDSVNMGGGAKCANLRLDEEEIFSMVKNERIATGRLKLGAMIGEGVRIGVNTSIMPGIKIGQGSHIGSGIVLDSDIPEKSFVSSAKNSYTVTANTREAEAKSREAFRKLL